MTWMQINATITPEVGLDISNAVVVNGDNVDSWRASMHRGPFEKRRWCILTDEPRFVACMFEFGDHSAMLMLCVRTNE
jgi:hypothetical protein